MTEKEPSKSLLASLGYSKDICDVQNGDDLSMVQKRTSLDATVAEGKVDEETIETENTTDDEYVDKPTSFSN